jgi:predicted phosphodiesterase
VLAEVRAERPDLVVYCGDLTWGSLPHETLVLIHSLEIPARFVQGNADRAVGVETAGRGPWIASQHSPDDIAFLRGFQATISVEVDGLGPVCFSHGSPRSDEECVTERTPAERVREFMAGRDESVVVTAHVHLQYERSVAGIRCVGPGSVGLPYGEEPGHAFWALLGPDVELRRTRYDLEGAVARMRATDDPRVETVVGLMLEPPAREEVIADAEERVFAG